MFDAEFVCTVGYDAEVPCVTMAMKGYATTPLFRGTNERVLQCLKESGAHSLLGDVTDFILIGAEDQIWLNENWIPRAMEAGLNRVALTQPTYYFNRVAVETVSQRARSERLTIGFFADLAAARRWLKTEGNGGEAAQPPRDGRVS